MSTLFFLLNFYLLNVLIFGICSAIKEKSKLAASIENFLKKWLFWCLPLRLFIETYIDVTISTFVSIPAM